MKITDIRNMKTSLEAQRYFSNMLIFFKAVGADIINQNRRHKITK